jgi:hypothetical protein
MGAEATDKERISVPKDMLGCYGCSYVGRGGCDEFSSIFGCDMLHDNPQIRHGLQQWRENPSDELCLSIKKVNTWISDFSVHQQGQINLHNGMNFAK